MKNKNLILSIIFYILSIILLGVLIIGNVNSNLEISNIHNILFLIMLCLFTYIASFNLSKYINNIKPMTINLYFYLIMFIIVLLFVTVLSRINNFQLIFFSNHSIINNYFKNHVNLIPFHTVLGYIKDYNDNLNTIYLISNVYGNLILCMPFALFFPLLFKKQNKFINYFITIVLIVLGIELLQLITLSGSLDIDDFIFNITGSLIMYFIVKSSNVNALVRNIFLLEKNKINIKKLLLLILIICIIFLITFHYVRKVAEHYYYDYEEHNKIHNPYITFIYNKDCSDNNLFYENEIYKYYLDCYDKDSFYLFINNEDKLTVTDFLDNSKYIYNIDRVLSGMEHDNIKYTIEHKYKYYLIELNMINNYGYTVPSNFENDYVKVVVKMVSSGYELNFIPKKIGNTKVDISYEIRNGSEIVDIVKNSFNVMIDNNLELNFHKID